MDGLARLTRRSGPDGEGVWSCPPDAGVKLVDEHRQATEAIKARSPRRARYKPEHHCAGNAGSFRHLW
jgi:DNA-binding GntR family transcriptional regulator